jgi:hypothetical protein
MEDEKQRVEGDGAIAILWIMNLSTSTDLNRVDKFNRLHPASQGQSRDSIRCDDVPMYCNKMM